MAKKFKFRPEAVLRLREQREQLALRRLAEAQARVTEIQQSMHRVRRQMDEQDALVRDGVLTGTVDVQYISLYRRHVMALHRTMIQHAQDLQLAAGQLQQVRGEVLQTVKERKVMSRLKEKLRLRHLSEVERGEARELDDMTAMRFGHLRLVQEQE